MTQDLETEQSYDVRLLCFSTIDIKVWVFMGESQCLQMFPKKYMLG
jgi:hypothetical protein